MTDRVRTVSRADEPGNTGRDWIRRIGGETCGTFALVFVATGIGATAALMPEQIPPPAKALAPGLTIAALIYAIGDASGAHFNPVVSLAFTLKRVFPLAWLLPYWLAQLTGALVAASLLRVMFGTAAAEGVTRPHVDAWTAVALEVVLTWLLVTVVIGTADRARVVGPNAALAVGATLAAAGLMAGPLEGASMNPVLSAGPAIVNAELSSLWIYLVGPVVGATIAVATTFMLHGLGAADGDSEKRAAQGEKPRSR